MMSEAGEKKSFRIEIKKILAAAPEEFDLKQFAESSHIPLEGWQTIIDADSDFFRDGDRVCRREAVFCGRKFLITPETWEISEGVLIPGHRFVPYLDPEVFPYGTRFYIETKDGEYIYGVATAEDCGDKRFIYDTRLDLYFNTKQECIQFGARSCDVYILG